jgi:hypothetical protein
MCSGASVVIDMPTYRFDIETADGEKWQYLADDSGTFGNRPDLTFVRIEDLLAWVNALLKEGELTSFKRTLIGCPDCPNC